MKKKVNIFLDLEVPSLQNLWQNALSSADSVPLINESPRKWRESLPYIPTRLFDPINIPLVSVNLGRNPRTGRRVTKTEDVALVASDASLILPNKRAGELFVWEADTPRSGGL